MAAINLKKEYLSSKRHSNKSKVKKIGSKLKANPMYQFITFGIVLCLIQVLSMLNILPSSFADACSSTIIYCIVAIGFCLLLGYSGLASLGTAGFIALGCYMCFYSIQAMGIVGYVGAFIITILLSIVIGAIVGFISLRIEGIYLAIMTLALSEMIVKLLKTLKATLKVKPIVSNQVIHAQIIAFIIIAVFVLLTILISNLINSPTGRAMVAMKSSTSAAQAMGISLMKYRLLAFIISIIYAGIAGLLYMMYNSSITTSTSTLFTLSTSLYILGAVIIGGAKSIWGTTIGTFFIYGLETMVLSKINFFVENPGIVVVLSGILMVVICMFYPGGFAQLAYNLKMKFKKKKLVWEVKKYGKEA